MSAGPQPSPLASPGQLRAYAQLVRLPNVFTALADVALGTLALNAQGLLAGGELVSCGCLFLASACLYSGGMVWNDFFDQAQDGRERPFRPLPSGRVTPRAAMRLGILLLSLGWLFALAAGWDATGFNRLPVAIASILVVAILLYDAWLKRFWAGPIGMGLCRFLNVLMAFSIAGLTPAGVGAALSVGTYIVGVTWFARTEARRSNRAALTGAAFVMLVGLLLALPLGGEGTSPLFPYLLVGLAFWVGIPVGQAISSPIPARVQRAVKRAIFGLVVLDAVLALALAGTVGIVILAFLLPALYLGRWIYST